MRNITFSADEELIERARKRARREKKSLNGLFREWLGQYAAQPKALVPYEEVMRRLSHVQSSGPYTRDEMNRR